MSRELSTGDPAPALRLTAHDGSTVDLADATRNGTVVYFYPKAFTPGCTTEACDFRDNLAALKGQGYDVYGVSGDDPQELQRFVTEYHLPYTLLSDPDHAAAKEWGAWGGRTINGETSEGPLRSTFAIDPSGNLTHAQYRVDAQGHVPDWSPNSPTPPEPGRVPHTPRGQWPPGRTVTAAATSGWLPSCRLPSGRCEGTPLDHRGPLFVPS
ncbi:peroxiredoxin [Kocuria sp. ICS0012]|uniref:peroxiredoxin n=1 Tax=Kocuria sp. ICS0012 TaxID=1834155 RepID=UPI0007E9F6CF|nr:peroxiredoxin [Kocuria sp. ICS0012]OBA44266.1 hypothetical protein A5728_12975 [Kocuria sp. ICS0012]